MRDTTVYSQRDMENKTVYQMDFESILQKFSLIEYLILTKWNLETSEIKRFKIKQSKCYKSSSNEILFL